MELITKEKTRNTTFQKRKAGILKKANEFTILCDVDTLIIIYPPNSKEPEIWPENPEKIKKIIASYKSKKGESGRKTCDLKDFFEDRNKRIEDELIKAQKKNMEAKYSTWFDGLDKLNEVELKQFAKMLEDKERMVRANLAMILENKESMVRANLDYNKSVMNIQGPMFHNYMDPSLPSSHPNLNHHNQMMNGQLINRDHYDHGWFNDAAATSSSFIPMKREPMGYGYNPMYEGGVAYNNMINPWGYQPAMVPEFAMQETVSHVNNGVDKSVIDDPRRF